MDPEPNGKRYRFLVDAPEQYHDEKLGKIGPFKKGEIYDLSPTIAKILVNTKQVEVVADGLNNNISPTANDEIIEEISAKSAVTPPNSMTPEINSLEKRVTSDIRPENAPIPCHSPMTDLKIGDVIGDDNANGGENELVIRDKSQNELVIDNDVMTYYYNNIKTMSLLFNKLRLVLGLKYPDPQYVILSLFIDEKNKVIIDKLETNRIVADAIQKGIKKNTISPALTDLVRCEVFTKEETGDITYYKVNNQRIAHVIEDNPNIVSDYIQTTMNAEEITKSIPLFWGELTIDFNNPDLSTTLKEHILNDPEVALSAIKDNDQKYKNTDFKETKIIFENIPFDRCISPHNPPGKLSNKLVCVEGYIAAYQDVRAILVSAIYSCKRCGEYHEIRGPDLEEKKPIVCQNPACGRNGPFNLEDKYSFFTNARFVRVKSTTDSSNGIAVVLWGDDAGEYFPGETIKAVGILRTIVRSTQKGKIRFYYLDTKYITKTERKDMVDDEKVIQFIQKNPLIPHIKETLFRPIAGMDIIKEGLALSILSNVWIPQPSGYDRENINVLIISDPGQAKKLFSQLIQRVVDVNAASGGQVTGRGLVASKREDAELGNVIVTGILPKSDNGFWILNEIQQVSKEDQEAIIEAMEDGEVHYDKGGFSLKLNSRTTGIAFGNWDASFYDEYKEDSDQISQRINKTLLTRFDLVFLLRSRPEDIKLILETQKNKTQPTEEELRMIRSCLNYLRFKTAKIPANKEFNTKIEEDSIRIAEMYGNKEFKVAPARILRAYESIAKKYAVARLSDIVTEEDLEKAKLILQESLRVRKIMEDEKKKNEEKSQAEQIKSILHIIARNGNDGITVKDIIEETEIHASRVNAIITELLEKQNITTFLNKVMFVKW